MFKKKYNGIKILLFMKEIKICFPKLADWFVKLADWTAERAN